MRCLLVLMALLGAVDAMARRRSPSLVDKVVSVANEAMIAVPKDNEVCFSPDENCDVKLWKFIQSAKKSLDVAVFDITHPKIVHEILVQSKKIPVRIVVDRRQSKGEHSLVGLLLRGGADMKLGKQRGIMHNKFVIIDGVRLETGSFNYTTGASEKNNENQIYLSTPEILARYRERFETIWNEATPVKRELTQSE